MHTTTTTVTTATGSTTAGTAPTTLVVALLLLLTIVLSGCGSGGAARGAAAGPGAEGAPSVTATPVDATADAAPATTVARADGEVAVHDGPGGDLVRTLPATTGFGTQTVLLVSEVGRGDADGWLEVLLPVRPNGTTGWIRTADVELRDVALTVEVDLDARRLVVREGDEELVSTRTAIGRDANPTPTGRFYVVDKLETPDPSGAYGPYAIGLSARSEVLTEFGGGDGQIGIHGTNVPDSIGRAVSHGCLRVGNRVVERLAHLLPLGTPVTIV